MRAEELVAHWNRLFGLGKPAPAAAPQMPSNILTYEHSCSECGGPLIPHGHDSLYCEECGLVL